MNTFKINKCLIAVALLAFLGCQKTDIPTGEPPVADFIFQAETGNIRKINFASTAKNADFINWDFGDNLGRSFTPSASYEYLRNGTFTVKMTVSNRFGVNTKAATVTINAPLAPDAAFAVSFAGISSNLAVLVKNNSTNAVTYRWDFGDGTTTTTAEPGGHTYRQPGRYTILLEALDAAGDVRDRQRTTLAVLDEKHLSANNANWGFRPGLVNSLSAYHVIQNGQVAFSNTLLDCELNDRYTFSTDGIFENKNQGDGRIYSRGGECRPVPAPANSQWALRRQNLEQFVLEVGNNYLGDAESSAEYVVRSLTAAELSVEFERPNPVNNQIRDKIVLVFVPR